MSSDKVLLGIQLGTKGCKAIAVSIDGKVLGEGVVRSVITGRRSRSKEQDAREWWRMTTAAARQAVISSGVRGSQIIGAAASSHRQAFVPVGETGEPLTSVIVPTDPPAEDEAAALLEKIPAGRVFEITGKRPDGYYPLPRIMKLAKTQPEVISQTHKLLMAHDYITCRLTSEAVTDHTLASGTLAHDVTDLKWSDEMLSTAGVSQNLLPEVRQSGAILGRAIREYAEVLGIAPATIIGVGGGTRKCAALGAGVREGIAAVSLGTASVISAVTPGPVLDKRMRLLAFPFVLPGKWSLEGEIRTAGGALAWLKNSLFAFDYAALDSMAEQAFEGTRKLFFFPHLAGSGSPMWDREDAGAFTGITLSTEPSDMVRAVLEGIAYQIRINIETLEDLGCPIRQVKLYGGGSSSAVWSRMIADVLGRPVAIPDTTDVAAVGACMLAGIACGAYSGAEEASVLLPDETVIEPDEDMAREYSERFGRYKEMQGRLNVLPAG